MSLRRAAAAWAALAFAAASAGDEPENHRNLGDALEAGKLGIALRYRYEHVTDDAFDKDADASTLRTAVSYESGRFHRLFGFLELENTADLGARDQHASGTNGVTDRPSVLDPRGTEVNAVHLGYEGFEDTRLVAGRQEITYDDHRFVGNSGWRQNRQSFDAVRVTETAIPRTTLDYSYVTNTDTVTGTNQGGSHHLFQATVDVGRLGSVTAYLFRLDFDSPDAALSALTYGGRWAGKLEAGKLELPFRVELAEQDDAADNPGTVSAGYRRLEIGIARAGAKLGLGYELLAGSPEDGTFRTPLATLHKFNGWADKFTTTPADGLADLWLSAGLARGRFTGTLVYHRFEADAGGAHYGDEIDAEVVFRAKWEQDFAVKAALYDARDLFADTDKLWFYSAYRF